MSEVGEQGAFLTPERFAREQGKRMVSTRGRLLIVSCTSGTYLARDVVARYADLLHGAGSRDGLLHLYDVDFRFANDETCVRLDKHVGGYDIYLFQGLCDPVLGHDVDHNYLAFLIAARTLREQGARHVTAVLPYLAYSRQDKPTEFKREPTTARLMADLSVAAGIDRLITWHAHCGQIRGFYGAASMTMLSSLQLFIQAYVPFAGREDVIAVAPDAGASKYVMYFSRALGLKMAVASKFRPRPDEAVITEVVGDFRDKRVAIVVDDELSTGGTVYGLVCKLHEELGIDEVYYGVSHNRCVPEARQRLLDLHANHGLQQVLVTDSIPQTAAFTGLSFLSVRSLADALSRTINRIHYNRSVSEVFTES